MTYQEKYKLFKQDYPVLCNKLKGRNALINLIEHVSASTEISWMKGFEACEKIYDEKLQKFLDERGI